MSKFVRPNRTPPPYLTFLNALYVEEERCDYEHYAERAENMYTHGKEVFGRRGSWGKLSKRTRNREVYEYWVANYKECSSSDLAHACKKRMTCFLKKYDESCYNTCDAAESKKKCQSKLYPGSVPKITSADSLGENEVENAEKKFEAPQSKSAGGRKG